MVAKRVGLELGHIHPRPPAVRLFDAGMGDGTVLARVMREMHRRFPTVPFYIVGKEISLEDVRLSLRKMVDRFYEHPATVLVVTNMYYTEAPWLTPRSVPAATSMVWHELALTGTTAHDFAEQISALEPFLAKNWQARHSPKTGNPIYDHPTALVIYRDDYRFLLERRDPEARRGQGRLRHGDRLAALPAARAARIQGAEGGRRRWCARSARAGACSASIRTAQDPGLEIIQKVWPGENPYTQSRHDMLRATKAELGKESRRYNFNAYADARALSATRCTRCRARSRRASAPRRCSPPGTPPSTSRRSTMRGSPKCCATPATLTPRERSCKNMAASGSSTNRMSSPASAIEQGVQARLSELLIGGSLELMPREMHRAAEIAALLPKDTCVYMPSLPGLPLARTLEAVAAIRAAGLDPVPHVSAQTDPRTRTNSARSCKEAVTKHGVHRVLLLGGDEPKAKGPVQRQPADPRVRPARRLAASARSASPAIPKAIRASRQAV